MHKREFKFKVGDLFIEVGLLDISQYLDFAVPILRRQYYFSCYTQSCAFHNMFVDISTIG